MGDRDGGKGVDRMLAQNSKQTALRGEGWYVAARWFLRGKRWQEGGNSQDLQRTALSEVISLHCVAAPGHMPHTHVQEGLTKGKTSLSRSGFVSPRARAAQNGQD